MSNELETKLVEIKRQKDIYLTPENIRKGISIFNIVGTLVEEDFKNKPLWFCKSGSASTTDINYYINNELPAPEFISSSQITRVDELSDVVRTSPEVGDYIISLYGFYDNTNFNTATYITLGKILTINVDMGIYDFNFKVLTGIKQSTFADLVNVKTQYIKEGITMLGVKGSYNELYTPLEYIQSTGTQYINTGINPDGSLIIEMEWFDESTDNNMRIFGAYSGDNTDWRNSYGLSLAR